MYLLSLSLYSLSNDFNVNGSGVSFMFRHQKYVLNVEGIPALRIDFLANSLFFSRRLLKSLLKQVNMSSIEHRKLSVVVIRRIKFATFFRNHHECYAQ